MLSFLAVHPPRTNAANALRLTFDEDRSWIEFCPPTSRFLVKNHWPPAAPGSSIGFNSRREPPFMPQCSLHPPLHWHRFQSETFHVLKGTAKFSVDGKEVFAGEGEEVTVPKAAFHSYCNASSTEEMDIEFVLEPKSRKRDEAFFRNIQTARDDYRKIGMRTPYPQTLLFMRSADTVPVLPGPQWIAKPLGLLIQLVVGVVWGKWILGYKERYPEYSGDFNAVE